MADEPRRGGRASNIPRSACRISKATSLRSRRDGLHARRDQSGDPEDVREAGHPLAQGHHARVHGARVVTGSPPPALSPLTPVPQVSLHPDVRNCSCDAAQANVQAALLASGDGNNECAAKVAQHVSAWHTEGDHLDQRHGAIELTARRGVRRTQAVRAVRPDHPFDPGAIRP